MEPEDSSNGGENAYIDDADSSSSTPYYSAPSSPGRSHSGYYYSAPASPMHFVLASIPYSLPSASSATGDSDSVSDHGVTCYSEFEFDFSARFCNSGDAPVPSSMSSADELFLNGQIRPMKLSSHLQRPQVLAPLLDLDEEEELEQTGKPDEMAVRGRDLRMRSRSIHQRARSLSPFRSEVPDQWRDDEREVRGPNGGEVEAELEIEPDIKEDGGGEAVAPSVSASSSRSSSSGRNSKRWVFLKDLLYRSKSEGRGNGKEKEKFWQSISFSPSKEKSTFLYFSRDKSKGFKQQPTPPSASASVEPNKPQKQRDADLPSTTPSTTATGPQKKAKPSNVVGKRRMPAPSAHERHYTANRAQAEELRRKTYLPYRQGLLGCLGFTSRSYGAMNGFARALHPVSSR